MLNMKRVKITKISKINSRGALLYQVKLLQDIDSEHLKGSLGGWIASEDNLRNPETGIVEGVVLDSAEVYEKAKVYDSAIVKDDNTKVFGNAIIRGNAKVGGQSIIQGETLIEDNVVITNRCLAAGKTHLFGNLSLFARTKYINIIKSITPFQLSGSRHPILVEDDIMSIGCIRLTLTEWLDRIQIIGEENNYSKSQIKEYTKYLTNYIKNS